MIRRRISRASRRDERAAAFDNMHDWVRSLPWGLSSVAESFSPPIPSPTALAETDGTILLCGGHALIPLGGQMERERDAIEAFVRAAYSDAIS